MYRKGLSIFQHPFFESTPRQGRVSSSEEGFTLVEPAIVLVIIGLLIGGVLKGQEMIDSSRAKSLVSRVKTYRAALTTFQDKYGYLPGDYPSANTRLGATRNVTWVKCTRNRDECDGNGQIVFHEAKLFWQHLVAADLISGVSLTADPALRWGESYPTAPVGGGFIPAYRSIHNRSLNFLTVSALPDNWLNGTMKPGNLQELDKKFDDGWSPVTGQLMAVQSVANECFENSTKIYASGRSKACIPVFSLW